jgi:predicted RNA-binding Zn ribbon-like protein
MGVIRSGRNHHSAYSGYVDDPQLVVDFLNTLDVENGTDLLTQPAGWERWAAERGLRAGPPEDARTARAALRAAAGDPDSAGASPRVPVHVELSAGRPTLVAASAVEAVMIAAARLQVLGDWARVKICPADDCRWAFYDQSRNRSRAWCSMRVCGNRQKARAWRQRTLSPDGVTHS